MLKYDLFLLDADNTLFDFAKAEKHSLSALMGQYGITVDDHLYNWFSSVNQHYWNLLSLGKIEKKDVILNRFSDVAAKVHLNVSPHDLNEGFQFYLRESTFLLEGALELCQILHQRGGKLAIATNGIARTQRSRLEKSEIFRYISEIIVSEEAGAEKPASQFYDYAFQLCGRFAKNRVLMVGDSLISDMQGGINYGLDTCWYNPMGLENKVGLPITYTVQHLAKIIEIAL